MGAQGEPGLAGYNVSDIYLEESPSHQRGGDPGLVAGTDSRLW